MDTVTAAVLTGVWEQTDKFWGFFTNTERNHALNSHESKHTTGKTNSYWDVVFISLIWPLLSGEIRVRNCVVRNPRGACFRKQDDSDCWTFEGFAKIWYELQLHEVKGLAERGPGRVTAVNKSIGKRWQKARVETNVFFIK